MYPAGIGENSFLPKSKFFTPDSISGVFYIFVCQEHNRLTIKKIMRKHFSLFTFHFSLAIAIMIAMASCDVAKQAQGAYNMVNCKYDYQSLNNFSVAGINVSKGISLLDAPKIVNLLTGNLSSVPVGMTVNLGVTNPNQTEAMLNGLDYVLAIDGIDFTSGALQQQLSVPAGGTGTLPLAMSFDIATLLKGDTHTAVANVVKNMVGIGSDASKVTLNIRPSFMVLGQKVTSPVYIPISFSFGGK